MKMEDSRRFEKVENFEIELRPTGHQVIKSENGGLKKIWKIQNISKIKKNNHGRSIISNKFL